jgi:hypothetical protein
MKKVLPALLIAVVLLCVLGAILDGGDDDEAAPVAEPTSAREQPTLIPTPEPVATATSEPVALSEREAYIEALRPAFENLSGGLTDLGGLMGDPQLGEQSWTVAVALATLKVEDARDQVAAITPPADLADAHAQLVRVFNRCDASVEELRPAIDERSVERMGLAGQLLELCQSGLRELNESGAFAAP